MINSLQLALWEGNTPSPRANDNPDTSPGRRPTRVRKEKKRPAEVKAVVSNQLNLELKADH